MVAVSRETENSANHRRRQSGCRPEILRIADIAGRLGRCASGGPATRVLAMAGVASREAYFEAGLDVLSDLGYGGLKLAVGVPSTRRHDRIVLSLLPQLVGLHQGFARPLGAGTQRRRRPRPTRRADPRRRIDTLIEERAGASPRRRGGDPGVEFHRPRGVRRAVGRRPAAVRRPLRVGVRDPPAQAPGARCSRRGGCTCWSGTSRSTLPRDPDDLRVDRRPAARRAGLRPVRVGAGRRGLDAPGRTHPCMLTPAGLWRRVMDRLATRDPEHDALRRAVAGGHRATDSRPPSVSRSGAVRRHRYSRSSVRSPC